MDGPPSKRRKLLDWSQVATVPSSSASPRDHDVIVPSEAGRASAKGPSTPATSAHAAWQQAKKMSAGYRKRTLSHAVGDPVADLRHADPVRQADGGEGKLKSVKKHNLDPLRNQQGHHLDQSPLKAQSTSVKPARVPGFFKRFLTAKKDVEKASGDGIEQVGIADARPEPDAIREAGGAEPAGTALERRKDSPAPSDGDSRRQDVRTGAAQKTFEEQIREIEAKAKLDAEVEEQEGLYISGRNVRRAKERPDAGEHKTPQSAKKQPHAPATARPLDRRKRHQKIKQPEPMTNAEPRAIDEAATGRESETLHDEAVIGSMPPKAASPSKPLSANSNAAIEPESIRMMQRLVLERLAGKQPIPLTNLSEAHAKVSLLVDQTIVAGESNSMLLIGARGSGKTALVDTILRQQALEHAEDFHVVRLNGFIHTDDKIALREIWHQLGRDMGVVDEYESAQRNYADTLTTLLALLGSAEETGRHNDDGQVSKSVIFVLDEFDLFAQHPRQTLLYNLFDIAQSRKAPIAVLGLTTRIDVAEALEKRVKSRFSHRFVYLGLPKNYASFCDIVGAALRIENEALLSPKAETSGHVGDAAGSSTTTSKSDGPDAVDQWNSTIDALLSNVNIDSHLRRLYNTTKSIPDALATLYAPLASIPSQTTLNATAIITLVADSIATLAPPLAPDSKLPLLSSLSTLQLALLICAARLTNIYDADVVGFTLAYEEYKALASKAKLQATSSGMAGASAGARVWGREIARGAWEELMGMGLLIEDGRSGTGKGRCDVGLEEIGMLGGLGVDLGGWGRWCREI